ncbi:MAG TPA: hypothetical protein VF168_07500 [Trueperaceae bacterium]
MAVIGSAESSSVAKAGSAETWVVLGALTLGWTLGFVGNFLPEGAMKLGFWVLSSIGLMTGATLLAIRHVTANVMLSAGLMLLVVGETVVHSQGPGGADAFAAATYAYFPGLLLVALSGWGPLWMRLAALVSALAFVAHASSHVLGGAPAPDGPLAGTGYAFLTLTVIGWTWVVSRQWGRPPVRRPTEV